MWAEGATARLVYSWSVMVVWNHARNVHYRQSRPKKETVNMIDKWYLFVRIGSCSRSPIDRGSHKPKMRNGIANRLSLLFTNETDARQTECFICLPITADQTAQSSPVLFGAGPGPGCNYCTYRTTPYCYDTCGNL